MSGERILSAAPLYHSYALGAALIAALVSGGCLYTVDRFVPRKILELIQQYKINIAVMVPMMARAICNTFSAEQYDLSSIRVALVGAGQITEELYVQFKQRFGITLSSNYGSTETGGIVSRLEPLPFTSIGKPMCGVEIKIYGDCGEPVSAGQEGELWVRCGGMFKGYLGENSAIFDSEGFFPMGDIVLQDKDGYLYIKGRKKLLVNIGGKKVNPYEVEEVLRGYPGVKECAVVGAKRANMEEYIKAVIVGEGIEEIALRNYCAQILSRHKIPSIIIFRDSIPKNRLGKINREELAMLK